MIKLLIADDEIIARIAFISIVEKNCPDIEVVGEASNGEEAVRLTQMLSPEIIIMDIQMPGLNGLDASRIILERNPDMIILILTAFDDSDFLQQAINMGIKGYFLKPLKAGEIISRLNSISVFLSTNQVNKTNKIQLEKKIQKLKTVSDREIIRTYISGSIETIDSELSDFGYDARNGYFILIAIRNCNRTSDSREKDLSLKRSLFITVSEILVFLKPGMIGCFNGAILPVFIPLPEQFNLSYEKRESKIIADEIIRRIKNRLHVETSVAIGTISIGSENFKNTYQDAFSIVQQIPPGEAVFASQFKPEMIKYNYPYQQETSLLNLIRLKETEKAKSLTDSIITDIFTNAQNYQQIQNYSIQLICSIKRSIFLLGISPDAMDSFVSLYQTVLASEPGDLEIHFRLCCDYLINLIRQQNNNRNFAVKQRINQYLKENSAKSITLKNLSEHLNLSMQYVSKIFKEEFGENLTEYVTKQRIEQSKNLLLQTKDPISNIAIKIGYSDSNYFCRIFKKQTGLTPKEFRKLADK